MKILVISLLRVGDLLMLASCLQKLKTKYPQSELHLLINKSSQMAAPLLKDVTRVHAFDRDYAQESLGEADSAILESFDYVSELIDSLASENFDLVINFTQNKLSAYIAGLIPSKNRSGLSFSSNDLPIFSSAWFRYLNDHVAAGSKSIFHYNDLFAHGLELDDAKVDVQLRETEKGKRELEELLMISGYPAGRKYVLQMLTSDEKKNLGINKWQAVIEKIHSLNPHSFFYLLCAPHERELIEPLALHLEALSVPHAVAVMSFDGAFSLFNICEILLTGDTSLKHLACGSNIKILEVALGGSDYRKTGVYKENSLIISSKEACAPCDHFKPCHRASHLCAATLPEEMIALSAEKLLANDWIALRILANEYNDVASMYRTHFYANRFWGAVPLDSAIADAAFAVYLDCVAWKFYLNREHLQPLAKYGSVSVGILEDIQTIWAPLKVANSKVVLEFIEAKSLSNELKLNEILSNLSSKIRFQDGMISQEFLEPSIKNDIEKIAADLGLGRALSEKLSALSQVNIQNVRSMQNILNEAFNHQKIKIKLLRSMRSQVVEYI